MKKYDLALSLSVIGAMSIAPFPYVNTRSSSYKSELPEEIMEKIDKNMTQGDLDRLAKAQAKRDRKQKNRK